MSDIKRSSAPYICRLAPREGGFTADFIDNGAENASDAHIVYWRQRGEGEWNAARPERKGDFFTVSIDCENERDYELFAERLENSARSSVRLVRTGFVPGTVINYLHPEDPEYTFSGRYLCSP